MHSVTVQVTACQSPSALVPIQLYVIYKIQAKSFSGFHGSTITCETHLHWHANRKLAIPIDWYKISKYVLGSYYCSSKVTLTDGLSLEMCGAIEQNSEIEA
jgi:hypothetical protein